MNEIAENEDNWEEIIDSKINFMEQYEAKQQKQFDKFNKQTQYDRRLTEMSTEIDNIIGLPVEDPDDPFGTIKNEADVTIEKLYQKLEKYKEDAQKIMGQKFQFDLY